MAIQILSQIIEYDKSARAWAQIRREGMRADLVRYHNSKAEAILAALPADLRTWAKDTTRRHPRLGKRPLKAAVIIATGRVQPSPRFAEFYDVLGDSGTTYQVSPAARVCSCEDNRRGHYCKHLLAARYVERQAGQNPSLWDLAQAAVKEHTLDADLQHLEIWRDATGTRQAALVQRSPNHTAERMPYGHWLHLIISGFPISLRVAEQATHMLDGSSFWRWTCSPREYQEWVHKIQD